MRNQKYISWWIPFPAHARAVARGLTETFSPRVMVRLALVTTLISIAWALVLRMHDLSEEILVMDYVKAAWLRLAGVLMAMSACAFIPQMIIVDQRGIGVVGLRTRCFYPEIEEIHVEASATPYALLSIRLKSREEPVLHPISPKVSPQDLIAFLSAMLPGRVHQSSQA
jgi:hypothetical protein